jgi:hypothetical protein
VRLSAILMFFDIFLDFLPLWSFFDVEMRADLDFFDAENTSPIYYYEILLAHQSF